MPIAEKQTINERYIHFGITCPSPPSAVMYVVLVLNSILETITNIAKALEVEPCELFVDIKKCVKMKNHKEALKLLEKFKNNEIKTAIAHDFLKLLDMLE